MRSSTSWLTSALAWILLGPVCVAGESCPSFTEMGTRERLLLIHCIPIGARPTDIARLIPKFVATPYAGSATLTEGSVRANVLGHPTELTFGLEADSVYTMYYNVDLPAATGDSLFGQLVTFYTEHYGPCRVADGQDSPYFRKDRRWCTSAYEVLVGCSMAGERRLVGWGFQTSTVECLQEGYSEEEMRAQPNRPLHLAAGETSWENGWAVAGRR